MRWGRGHQILTLNFQTFKIRIAMVAKNWPLNPFLSSLEIPSPGEYVWICAWKLLPADSSPRLQAGSYGLLDLLSTPIKLHIRSNQAPISVETR